MSGCMGKRLREADAGERREGSGVSSWSGETQRSGLLHVLVTAWVSRLGGRCGHDGLVFDGACEQPGRSRSPESSLLTPVIAPATHPYFAGDLTGVRRLDSGDRDRPGCSHAHPGAHPRRSSAVCSASGTTPHAIPRGPWVTTVRSG